MKIFDFIQKNFESFEISLNDEVEDILYTGGNFRTTGNYETIYKLNNYFLHVKHVSDTSRSLNFLTELDLNTFGRFYLDNCEINKYLDVTDDFRISKWEELTRHSFALIIKTANEMLKGKQDIDKFVSIDVAGNINFRRVRPTNGCVFSVTSLQSPDNSEWIALPAYDSSGTYKDDGLFVGNQFTGEYFYSGNVDEQRFKELEGLGYGKFNLGKISVAPKLKRFIADYMKNRFETTENFK